MNMYAAYAACFISCIGAGAYLAAHDCQWWAFLCFVMAASVSFKETKGKEG